MFSYLFKTVLAAGCVLFCLVNAFPQDKIIEISPRLLTSPNAKSVKTEPAKAGAPQQIVVPAGQAIPAKSSDTVSLLNCIWDNRGGSWELNSDLIRQTDDSAQPALFIAQGVSYSNYVLTFKARRTSAANDIGLVFNYADQNNYLDWNFGSSYGDKSIVEYKNNGVVFFLGNSATVFTLESERWYDVKAVISERSFEGFLDGVLRVKTVLPEDASTSGAFGFRSWSAAAEFKDLRIFAQ